MSNTSQLSARLYALRKQARLSQEDLADQLGVSRQAVSKWECGESLPDTDNLISLAKLYHLSLDELVCIAPPPVTAEAASESEIPTPDSATETDHDEDDSDDEDNEETPQTEQRKKKLAYRLLYALPYPILVTIAFFLWGFLANGWKVAWTLFLTVPIYYSVIDAIRLRRLSSFCYPLLATFAYCFIGMQWHIWHPTWILFVTIPVYYAITEPIDIYNRKKHR